MTIYKALQKIDTLTKPELVHVIQLIDADIANYQICIENYPPDRMKKHGLPALKRLHEKRQKFLTKLNQL